MTLYYVKQPGCGEIGCCGEYYQEIDETFVDCECGIPGSEMTADHLQCCEGGGVVLKWRKASRLEIQAFLDGGRDGFQEGYEAGIEWQKKQGEQSKSVQRRLNVENSNVRTTTDNSINDTDGEQL